MIPLGILASASARGAAPGLSLFDEIMADSPFGYWRINEAAGAAVIEESANNRDLTVVVGGAVLGSTSLTPDGQTSVLLDDVDDYLTTGNNAYGSALQTAFNGDLPFTLMAVVKPTAANGNILHAGNYSVNNSQGILIGVDGAGDLYTQVRVDSTFAVLSATGLSLVGAPHIVHVTRAAGGQTYLYVDGVQEGAGSIAGSVRLAASTSFGGVQIAVGAGVGVAGSGNPAAFFGGNIAHAAMFAGALSPTRVLAHAQAAGFA